MAHKVTGLRGKEVKDWNGELSIAVGLTLHKVAVATAEHPWLILKGLGC